MKTSRFLEFPLWMHFYQVFDWGRFHTFSPKESKGLFAAKSPGLGQCLACFFLAVAAAVASPAGEGISAYEKGEFATAARAFETALASGPKSAGLYYNLAQSLKKEGDTGAAALNYRRALMLDPRLMDARMALSDTERSKAVPMAPTDWRDWLAERVDLLPLLLTGFVLFWIGAFWLVIGQWLRSGWGSMTLAGVIVLLGAVLFAAGALADPRLAWRSGAVVISQEGASLLSAPADRSNLLAKLPSGTPLHWKRTSGEWVYASTLDGKSGWVPAAQVERLLPEAARS